MAYIPPRYAPRDDWKTVLPNIGTANSVNSWTFDMVVYHQLRTPPSPLEIGAAWRRCSMPKDHALSALSQSSQPPAPNNASGLVPPEIAGRLFARALADEVDPETTASLVLDEPIPPVMAPLPPAPDPRRRCFTPPRYRPRADWQARLAQISADDGSWRADLARYWKLRLAGKTERQAWRDVAMTPAHARMALVEGEESPDSGLIPCLANAQETVARRVLSRSVATGIDASDIYDRLILEA